MRAGREAEFLHRGLEEALRLGLQRAVLADLPRGHPAVDARPLAAEPPESDATGEDPAEGSDSDDD